MYMYNYNFKILKKQKFIFTFFNIIFFCDVDVLKANSKLKLCWHIIPHRNTEDDLGQTCEINSTVVIEWFHTFAPD